MCMTVAAARGGLVVVAADRRWGGFYSDGSVERWDAGGKLRAMRNGWLAGTGRDGVTFWRSLEALDGRDASSLELVERGLHRSYHEALPDALERYPAAEPERNHFLLGRLTPEPSVFVFSAWGEQVKPGGGNRFFGTFPPEISEGEVGAYRERFGAALGACRTMYDLLTLTAALFAQVAPAAPSMSPEVEIGALCREHGHLFTTGEASAIAEGDFEMSEGPAPADLPEGVVL